MSAAGTIYCIRMPKCMTFHPDFTLVPLPSVSRGSSPIVARLPSPITKIYWHLLYTTFNSFSRTLFWYVNIGRLSVAWWICRAIFVFQTVLDVCLLCAAYCYCVVRPQRICRAFAPKQGNTPRARRLETRRNTIDTSPCPWATSWRPTP